MMKTIVTLFAIYSSSSLGSNRLLLQQGIQPEPAFIPIIDPAAPVEPATPAIPAVPAILAQPPQIAQPGAPQMPPQPITPQQPAVPVTPQQPPQPPVIQQPVAPQPPQWPQQPIAPQPLPPQPPVQPQWPQQPVVPVAPVPAQPQWPQQPVQPMPAQPVQPVVQVPVAPVPPQPVAPVTPGPPQVMPWSPAASQSSPFHRTNKLECKITPSVYVEPRDTSSCALGTFQINDPSDVYEVKCTKAGSCYKSTISMNLTPMGGPIIDRLKGFWCLERGSCMDSTIIINNQRGGKIRVDDVVCDKLNSCKNTQFLFGAGAYIESGHLHCNTYDACTGCTINMNGITEPCTNYMW